tara:strand:+ start:60 stop:377 length:318 start_codon:yes stop_codon:yes gene_type:complete
MDVILDTAVIKGTLEFKDKLKQVRQISLTDKDGMPIDKRLQVTVGSMLENAIVNALAKGWSINIGDEGYINIEKAKYCLNGGDLGKDYAKFFSDDEFDEFLKDVE